MTNPADVPSPGDQEPHKPADDREEVYYEGSPLLRGNLRIICGWWLVSLLLIAAPFIWHHFKTTWPIWWASLACVGLAILCIFIPILIVRSEKYRISNYRIDFESGILSKTINTLELWHVEDITFHQSLWDRILHVGSIEIDSSDRSTSELHLTGLPNPRPIFESLKQRIISVKRQRGVVKFDAPIQPETHG